MLGIYLFALVVGGGMLLFAIVGDIFGGGDVGDGSHLDLGGGSHLDLGGDGAHLDFGGDASHLDVGGDGGVDLAGEIHGDLGTEFGGPVGELGAGAPPDLGGAAHLPPAGLGAESDALVPAGGPHPVADTGPHFKLFSLRTITYFLFGLGASGAALTFYYRGERPILTAVLALVTGSAAGLMVASLFHWLGRTESGATEGEGSFAGLAGRVSVPFVKGGVGKVVVRRGDRVYELMARPWEGETSDPAAWRAVVVVEMQRGTALVAPLEDDLGTES